MFWQLNIKYMWMKAKLELAPLLMENNHRLLNGVEIIFKAEIH